MGVRVLYDTENDVAALYDSVTETAFGRLFHGYKGGGGVRAFATQVAEAFLAWYGEHGAERDPRADTDIGSVQDDWVARVLPGMEQDALDEFEA